jgi:hypothetical protein
VSAVCDIVGANSRIKKKSYPCNRARRPIELRDVEDQALPKQMAVWLSVLGADRALPQKDLLVLISVRR